MEFNIEDVKVFLGRTPNVLSELLEDLPDTWIESNEGEGTWSPYENLAHLIHGEYEDWIPRLILILEHGEESPFTPFDPWGFKPYCENKTLADLLNNFRSKRTENLEVLGNLNLEEEDFEKTGKHPAFGKVSVRQLLSTWTVHDLGHISQITRVLAKQYKTEIGPWSEYLPIVTK